MSFASSPCTGLCTVDPVTELCLGCGRTLGEIGAWSSLAEPERLAIMAGLHHRLENHDETHPSVLDAEASAP